jgi:hypothetical protein
VKIIRKTVDWTFMTGYSAEMAQIRYVVETGAAFIQKPYGIAALSHKVREALDSRALAYEVSPVWNEPRSKLVHKWSQGLWHYSPIVFKTLAPA